MKSGKIERQRTIIIHHLPTATDRQLLQAELHAQDEEAYEVARDMQKSVMQVVIGHKKRAVCRGRRRGRSLFAQEQVVNTFDNLQCICCPLPILLRHFCHMFFVAGCGR